MLVVHGVTLVTAPRALSHTIYFYKRKKPHALALIHTDQGSCMQSWISLSLSHTHTDLSYLFPNLLLQSTYNGRYLRFCWLTRISSITSTTPCLLVAKTLHDTAAAKTTPLLSATSFWTRLQEKKKKPWRTPTLFTDTRARQEKPPKGHCKWSLPTKLSTNHTPRGIKPTTRPTTRWQRIKMLQTDVRSVSKPLEKWYSAASKAVLRTKKNGRCACRVDSLLMPLLC